MSAPKGGEEGKKKVGGVSATDRKGPGSVRGIKKTGVISDHLKKKKTQQKHGGEEKKITEKKKKHALYCNRNQYNNE